MDDLAIGGPVKTVVDKNWSLAAKSQLRYGKS